MRCALSAATWARQQRLLMFLRGGYFGRLIYQWSRWCPNEFITCKEFACSSPQCLCALARERVRVWMLPRSRTLPALLCTVPVTVGLRQSLSELGFFFSCFKIRITFTHFFVCMRQGIHAEAREQLEGVSSLLLP